MKMNDVQRSRFLDRSFDKYFECMSDSSLQAQLEEYCTALGYEDAVDYVSNQSNFASIAYPEKVDTNSIELYGKIPVLGLFGGEKTYVASSHHPLQLPKLEFEYSSEGHVTVPSELTIASVHCSIKEVINPTEDVVITQAGHPLLVVNMDNGYKGKDTLCPTVIGHEILHIAQVLCEPVQQYNVSSFERDSACSRLQSEIEAYVYQDKLFEGMLGHMGRVSSISLANSVAAVGRVTLGEGWRLSDAFISRAARDVFAARIIPDSLMKEIEASC